MGNAKREVVITNLKRRDRVGNLDVDGSIILKHVLKK
jgi:hypothetical protein